MGPGFYLSGLESCYDGSLRIPNWGPILGDHRIYVGSTQDCQPRAGGCPAKAQTGQESCLRVYLNLPRLMCIC